MPAGAHAFVFDGTTVSRACLFAVVVCTAMPAGPQRGFAENLAPGSTEYRFIPWLYYRENADGTGRFQAILRNYQSIGLDNGWGLNFREDMQFRWTDRTGPANEEGDWAGHIGDALLESTLATPDILPNFSMNFGSRLVFPSGGLPPFGRGRYQIAPVFVINLDWPDLGRGVEFTATARYFWTIGNGQEGSQKVRRLQFYPEVKIKLGEDWTFSLWSFNPIYYNDLTNKWFVPFDAMITKHVTDDLSLGIGGAVKLIDDYPIFDRMIYVRAALTF